MQLDVTRVTETNVDSDLKCVCGALQEIVLLAELSVVRCPSCGRGYLVPQSKPQDIFNYRSRVWELSRQAERAH